MQIPGILQLIFKLRISDLYSIVREEASLAVALLLEYNSWDDRMEPPAEIYRANIPSDLLNLQLSQDDQRWIVSELVDIVKHVENYETTNCVYAILKSESSVAIQAAIDLLEDVPYDAKNEVVYLIIHIIPIHLVFDEFGKPYKKFLDIVQAANLPDKLKKLSCIDNADVTRELNLALSWIMKYLAQPR